MSTSDDIRKLINKLKSIEKAATDSFLEVGKEAVKLIRKRTRLGFGVRTQGGNKKRLDKLSEGYKKTRKRVKPSGPTTPAKSNLTYTGDMLDDLRAKEKNANKVEIGFSSGESEDKAGWVSKDRPFNNLSKAETKQLQQMLVKTVKKETDKE
jgi:hypothetical protein